MADSANLSNDRAAAPSLCSPSGELDRMEGARTVPPENAPTAASGGRRAGGSRLPVLSTVRRFRASYAPFLIEFDASLAQALDYHPL
jgi:hypothetical protein